MRSRWHDPAPQEVIDEWLATAPRPLVLRPIGNPVIFHLVPNSEGEGFSPSALALARKAFAYKRNGAMRPIHPRLLALLYRAVRHFNVPFVTLISGYRTGRKTSRHTQGRAADIALPGVSDTKLVAFLRQQGFVGVGRYPTSRFVHVDVRSESFFWVDRSGPGRRPRVRAVAGAEAEAADVAALERGEQPVPDLYPSKSQQALAGRSTAETAGISNAIGDDEG